MEWQGIDLSNSRQRNWLKINLRYLITLFTIIIMMISIATFLFYLKQDLEHQYLTHQQEHKKIESKIITIKNRINQLKKNSTQVKNNYITKEDVNNFLQYLSNLKVKGIIESIQLLFDEKVKIKLISRSADQKQFDYIIHQLQQYNYAYKIDYFQQNDKNQIEFGLFIEIGKQNEKLDFNEL